MSIAPVILIADDDPDMINQFKLVLKPILDRIELSVAIDGLQAVQLCDEIRPDLLLLDHGMPGLDGFTACQMIRNMHPDREMAIWFITGLVQDDDSAMAMEAGADCLITKPINIKSLRDKIIHHLKIEQDDEIELHNFTSVDDSDPTAA